jgi:hypothetical protein
MVHKRYDQHHQRGKCQPQTKAQHRQRTGIGPALHRVARVAGGLHMAAVIEEYPDRRQQTGCMSTTTSPDGTERFVRLFFCFLRAVTFSLEFKFNRD